MRHSIFRKRKFAWNVSLKQLLHLKFERILKQTFDHIHKKNSPSKKTEDKQQIVSASTRQDNSIDKMKSAINYPFLTQFIE